MPTILLINGLRFFFYSNEGNEPMHIHVIKAEANGKIWIEPEIEILTCMGSAGVRKKRFCISF